ncbi:MAG: hypothetical protein ACTSPB_17440 [Candidatus Thorarchaeota archaeon]
MSKQYEEGTTQESFVDFLRRKTSEAKKSIEDQKKLALTMELDPIKKKCEEAALKGEEEIQVSRTEITQAGVAELQRMGFRVSNFHTQYASVTIAWDQEPRIKHL